MLQLKNIEISIKNGLDLSETEVRLTVSVSYSFQPITDYNADKEYLFRGLWNELYLDTIMELIELRQIICSIRHSHASEEVEQRMKKLINKLEFPIKEYKELQ